MAEKLVLLTEKKGFGVVDGIALSDADRPCIDVTNPATGELVARVPAAGAPDAEQAIEAARVAQLSWKAQPASERSRLLRLWFEAMLDRQDDIARTLVLEQGKPLSEALGEVAYAASFVRFYAEEATRLYGELIPSSSRDKRNLVSREPIGVCAAITPWNFPAAMVTRKAAPALAAGCTMVIKPSELTPVSYTHLTLPTTPYV